MVTPIQLHANDRFEVRLFRRGAAPGRFAWVYLVGHGGHATVEVVDDAHDPPPADLVVGRNTMLGTAVRAGAGGEVTIRVRTDATDGFQGALHIEAADPMAAGDDAWDAA